MTYRDLCPCCCGDRIVDIPPAQEELQIYDRLESGEWFIKYSYRCKLSGGEWQTAAQEWASELSRNDALERSKGC